MHSGQSIIIGTSSRPMRLRAWSLAATLGPVTRQRRFSLGCIHAPVIEKNL